MSLELFLYSKSACKPCTEAENIIAGLSRSYDIVCHVIKVDDDYELQQRYGSRVPVLEHAGITISERVLDRQAVMAWLKQQLDE